MESPGAVSRSYLAFASAVRRLVLAPIACPRPRSSRTGGGSSSSSRTLGASQRRQYISHSRHGCAALDSAASPSSSFSTLSPSSHASSADLPVYALFGLQDLVVQRLSEDQWTKSRSRFRGPIIDDLPLPYTRPPPPISIHSEETEVEKTAAAIKSHAVQKQEAPPKSLMAAPATRQRSRFTSAKMIQEALSRGQIDKGMILFSTTLRSMTQSTTYLPPSGLSLVGGKARIPIRGATLLRAEDFEAIVLDLKNMLIGRKKLVRTGADSRLEWRPEGLPKEWITRAIPDELLLAFAMGGTFDGCIAAGYQPSSRMIASLLSSFSHVLTAQDFIQAVEMGLSSRKANSIDLDVLTALIVGCGRTGQPDVGQEYLARYVASHPANGEEVELMASHSGLDADLVGWSHDGAVWEAIIRSYGLAGRHQKASHWLRRYWDFCQRTDVPLHIRPKPSASVYLTFIKSLTVGRPRDMLQARNEKVSSDVVRKVTDVLTLMKEGNVKPDTAILNFLADFEALRGEDTSALTLLSQIAPVAAASRGKKGAGQGENDAQGYVASEPRLGWDSHTFRRAFEVHANSTDQRCAVSLSRKLSLSTPRSLLASLLASHHEKTAGRVRITSIMHSKTLLSALKACLAVQDYPAAIVVLQTFEVCSVPFDAVKVYEILLQGVSTHSDWIAPTQTKALFRRAVTRRNSNGPTTQSWIQAWLRGLLEGTISLMLKQGEMTTTAAAKADLPQWVNSLDIHGEQWKNLDPSDQLHAVMDNVRREVLPSKGRFVKVSKGGE